MKKILIVYTDRFSQRNIETSDLVELLTNEGFNVETQYCVPQIDNMLCSLILKLKSRLYEIVKYRFMEVQGIKKQIFKHRFKKQKTLIGYDKLNTSLGFPFPKSKFLLNMLNKAFISMPACIERFQADLILVTNMQDSTAQSYIKYAERNGIKILPLVNSWDHLTHGGKAIESPAIPFYMVWNEIQKTELVELHGVPAEKICTVGALQYDYLKEQAQSNESDDILHKLFNVEKHKKIVFLPAYNDRHGKYEPFVIRKIIENKAKLISDIHVLIRPYPTDRTFEKRFGDVISDSGVTVASVSVNMFDDRKIMSMLLKHSDIVLSGCGTAAIEAMYYDTPVIHIPIDNNESHDIDTIEKSNYFSDHYVHIMNANASSVVFTVNELIEAVNSYLKDPNFKQKERQSLIIQQLQSPEQKSSQTIQRKISGVLNEENNI